MSSRGPGRPPSVLARLNPRGRPKSISYGAWRCLYCHHGQDSARGLLSHERICPARIFVEAVWERAIKKAKRRERVFGVGGTTA